MLQLQLELEDATAKVLSQLQELSRLSSTLNNINHEASEKRVSSLFAEIACKASDEGSQAITILKHVQNPLLQIAKAGMGLLSAGIGRLGLNVRPSTPVAHPNTADVILIVVVGGITYRDVMQIQEMLRKNPATGGKRIVLISTSVSSPDLLLQDALAIV